MSLLVELLIHVLLDYLVIGTARVLVFVLSLGRWSGDSSEHEQGHFPQLADSLMRVQDGRRVITRAGLFLIGSVFYLLALIGVVMAMVR